MVKWENSFPAHALYFALPFLHFARLPVVVVGGMRPMLAHSMPVCLFCLPAARAHATAFYLLPFALFPIPRHDTFIACTFLHAFSGEFSTVVVGGWACLLSGGACLHTQHGVSFVVHSPDRTALR